MFISGNRLQSLSVFVTFLANVNSCSCSLYVVVRPSVVCRLSSVTLVHPTQAIEIFGNVSKPFGTLAICDPSV